MRVIPWGILAWFSTGTSPGTLMYIQVVFSYLLSSKNATVSSSDCPTCVIRYHLTYFPYWSMPWSSRTSGTAWLSLEMGRKKAHSASKIQNFALRAVPGRRKFEHISYVREELGWPTVRQLYELHSFSFLHKIRPTGEPEALSSQPQVNSVTTYSALEPQGRTLILPSRAWGRRRVGGAYFLTLYSPTTAYRRRHVTSP